MALLNGFEDKAHVELQSQFLQMYEMALLDWHIVPVKNDVGAGRNPWCSHPHVGSERRI